MEQVQDGLFHQTIFFTKSEANCGIFSFSPTLLAPEYKGQLPIESISSTLELYYSSKVLLHVSGEVCRSPQNQQTTLEEAIKNMIYSSSSKDTGKRDKYKVYGELLSTYGYELKRREKGTGMHQLIQINRLKSRWIHSLRPMKIRRNFDKYNKLKRTYEALSKFVEETKQEIEHLESISTSLDIALKEEDLAQIKQELTEYGFIKKHGPSGKKVKITSRAFPLYLIRRFSYLCRKE